MRVLFLSQIVPYPPHGGVLQRGYNLIREIGRYNDVLLLAFVHPDVLGTPELIETSKRELGKHCAYVEYFCLWPKNHPNWSKLGLLWSGVSGVPFSVLAHRSKQLRTSIRRLLDSQVVDLVHYDTLALAQFKDAGGDLPSALTHHNVESQLMLRRAERERHALARAYLKRQARAIRAYEAACCPAFDVNITVSDVDARNLTEIAPGVRTETVANGVDVQYFRPAWDGPRSDRPSLIYAGGMNMFANRDAVLYFLQEIWPLVKQQVPNVLFYAVGQDPPVELRAMASRDPGVVVTGYLEDIRPLVGQAGVYVVPLRVGGGTRLKIVDAMAMGKAIVSTGVGAEGLRVTNGRDIMIADGAREFADVTIALLRDPQWRFALGTQARIAAENEYSWDRVGRGLQSVYESLIKRPRAKARQ